MVSEQSSDSENESVEKNNTSSNTKSTSTVTNTSPYYLGPSDNPGTPFVAATLKGENHRNWARSMRTTLRAKSKLGFIDGSIKKPAKTSPDFYNWEKADSMVMAWIINVIDPVLHGSISHASTAKDIWEDLEERFAQTNAPRIHQLWRTLCLMEHDHIGISFRILMLCERTQQSVACAYDILSKNCKTELVHKEVNNFKRSFLDKTAEEPHR